jgi:predicted nucleic acid-binding protein
LHAECHRRRSYRFAPRRSGARVVDLLLAAVACAAGLPLYTRNPDDFRAIGDLVEIVAA